MRCETVGNDVRMHPGDAITAAVLPPGSKSMTNRYLICAALADGTSRLHGVTQADDVERMVAGLRALGVRVDDAPDPRRADTATVTVIGAGGNLPALDAEIDAGAAGTTMRFLAALACLGRGRYRLDGSARMRKRPIGQLVSALQDLGAGIGYEDIPHYPPLTVQGQGLLGGELTISRPVSSQYLSALLMVAPYAAHDVMIRVDGELVSRPYLAMTIEVMRRMGAETVTNEDLSRLIIPAPQRYRSCEVTIEPDASAATYFWTAAAITGGAITVQGLRRDSLQGDARFIDVLAAMGCAVADTDDGVSVAGPEGGELNGVDIDLNAMPDTVQTLAAAALYARGPTDIRNVANLRLKETDRLAALGTELSKLGAQVEVREDGLTITPPDEITPAAIDTYDDHRMAMSLALVGLRAEGITIRNASCVSKSFPRFFDVLNQL